MDVADRGDKIDRPELPRRRFIRLLALAAGGGAALSLLASCAPAAPAAAPTAVTTAPGSSTTSQVAPTAASGAPTTAPIAAKGEPPAGATPRALRVTELQEITNFDPALMNSQDMGLIINNMYEGLVSSDRDTTNLVPKLAESWQLSPNGSTLTFALRQGVTFHDGTPFDADAAKFSFDRLKTINKGPETFLSGVGESEVVDQHTLRLSIDKNPRLALKATPLVMMVSPTAINANGKDDLGQKWIQQHSVGTGPYQLGAVNPQQNQTLTNFAGYWRGWAGNHVTQVDNLVQLDQAAARLMIEKGDVDITAFYNPDYAQALKQNPNLTVAVKRMPAPQYMMMNTKLKPLDDVRVRQAIAHAWNRDAWTQTNPDAVLGEQIAPAPLEILGADYKPSTTYEYDLDKAKALLAQAGYPNGGFSFTHYYLAGDDEKKNMAELLGSELSKLGIQMAIRSYTAARMFEMVKDYGETQNPASAIGMTTIFTTARFFDGHNWLDWHFNSDAWKYGRNFMYYANPTVDSLLAKAAAVLTDDEARPLYRQLSDLVMQDSPVIMIEAQVGKMALRNTISGFYYNLQMYPTTVTFYDLAKA